MLDTVQKRLLAVAASSLAVLSAMALCGWAGYDYGRSAGRVEVAQHLEKSAAAQAAAYRQAMALYVAETARANRAEQSLLEASRRFAAEKNNLRRRVADVSTVYSPDGTAVVALPRCVFTGGWVQLYNAAIGLPDLPAAAVASKSGSPAGTSQTAGARLRDSGVSQADVLAHMTDYGARCRAMEKQLTELIGLHNQTEAKK